MARLASHVGFVHVVDDRVDSDMRGLSAAFGPDEDIPEWAARKMGAHVFEGGEHPFPSSEDDSEREPGAIPPRAGKGSTRDNWAAYANDVDVDIPADAGRDDIIAAIEAAGKPTEYEN